MLNFLNTMSCPGCGAVMSERHFVRWHECPAKEVVRVNGEKHPFDKRRIWCNGAWVHKNLARYIPT